MEITILSTKGQIVLPKKIRQSYDKGSSFMITKINEMIVLKPIQGLDNKEILEIKELESIWKEIDSGKADSYKEEEFFKAMKKW